MKLHLPKALFTALLAACVAQTAWGEESSTPSTITDFTWFQTGTYTADAWADEEYWNYNQTGSGATMNNTAGPGTTDSNYWQPITVKGSGTADSLVFGSTSDRVKLEGWVPKFEIKDGTTLYAHFSKFQGDPKWLKISNSSTLNAQLGGYDSSGNNYSGNDGGDISVEVSNNSNFTLILGRRKEGGTLTIDLDETSQAAIRTVGSAVYSAGAVTLNLAVDTSTTSAWKAVDFFQSQNVTYSSFAVNTGTTFDGWSKINTEITADNYQNYTNCYAITQDSDGTYKLTYAVYNADNVYQWAGGALNWAEGTSFGGKEFVNGPRVHISADTEATLAANVSSSVVSIGADANVSLTGNGHQLSAEYVDIQGGTLQLKDNALAATTRLLSSGDEGQLIIDSAQEVILGNLNDYTGSVEITENSSLKLSDTLANFDAKVTGAGQLRLQMATNAEGDGDSRIMLAAGSSLSDIYTTGVVAYNKNNTAVESNFGGANLHIANGGTLLIRNGVSGTLDANIGDIYFDGDGELRVYGGVSNATIADDVHASGTLKKTDSGTVALSGIVDAAAIRVENGTLTLSNAGSRVQDFTVTGGTASIAKSVTVNNLVVTGGKVTTSSGNVNAVSNLVVNGGTLELTSRDGGDINRSITVTNGGTLEFNQSDIVSEGATLTLTLDNSTLDSTEKRFAMGQSAVLKLHNGIVKGGDVHGVVDFSKSTGKLVSSGTSEIQGAVRLRDCTLTMEITDTLTVGNIVQADGMTGHITKTGSGTLVIKALKGMGNSSSSKNAIQGNMVLVDGGIQFDLADETTSYGGTISGHGNITKSGTGSLTVAKVSDLDGDIAVTEGSLTITTLEATKTIGITASNENSLNIGAVNVLSNHALQVLSGNFTDDGTNSTTNGFANGEVSFRLFDNYVWRGTVDGYTVGSQDGDTTLSTTITESDRFYINEGTHSISSAGEYINGRADGYVINKGATLQIDAAQAGSMTAASILTSAVGDGNILLKQDVTLGAGSSTSVTGELKIQGVTLTMTPGKGQSVSISDFSSVVLDGGTIKLNAVSTTFRNVTATANGGSFKVDDMQDTRAPHRFIGTTTIEQGGTLTLETTCWRSNIDIDVLTGAGNLVVKDSYHSPNNADDTVVRVNALKDFTGGITVDGGADGVTSLYISNASDATLNGITLKGGATMYLGNSSLSSPITYTLGGAVQIGGNNNGGTLQVESGTTLKNNEKAISSKLVLNGGNAQLGGEKTLKGDVTIKKGSTLSFVSQQDIIDYGTAVTWRVEEGGTLDFGTIRQGFGSGSVLELAGGRVIGTDQVHNNTKLGVLDLMSGSKVHAVADTTVEANVRLRSTIEFEVDENKSLNIAGALRDDTFIEGGRIGALKKTGDGTLKLSNANDYSNGTYVNAGILETANDKALGTGKVTVNGGMLKLAEALRISAMDYMSGSIQADKDLTVTGTLKVAGTGDMTVTGSGKVHAQTLQLESGASFTAGGQVSMDNLTMNAGSAITVDSEVALNGKLTLHSGITLTGTVLDTLAGLQAPGSGEVVLFSGVNTLVLGDQTYTVGSETLNSGSGVKLSDYFRNDREIDFDKYYLAFNAATGDLTAGLIIPEPTTATLSLLALAGLCARRRRK